jgi:hypothetical protein
MINEGGRSRKFSWLDKGKKVPLSRFIREGLEEVLTR